MDVSVRMAMHGLTPMSMDLTADFHRNEQKTSVSHPALRDHVVGDVLHITAVALEDRDFHAAVVIEMNMHRRQRHIVMLMKRVHESICQLPH